MECCVCPFIIIEFSKRRGLIRGNEPENVVQTVVSLNHVSRSKFASPLSMFLEGGGEGGSSLLKMRRGVTSSTTPGALAMC